MADARPEGWLQGKVTLIGGGTAGIGLASGVRFADEGASVVLVGRHRERGLSAVARINERQPGMALYVQADVTEPALLEAAAEVAYGHFGRIDVIFANAAVNHAGAVDEISLADWQDVMNVNVTGGFNLLRAVLPYMNETGGSVIFTASEFALLGGAHLAAYCASKAAIIGLTKALAVELAPRGIRVNCLAPGPTMTEPFERSIMDPEAREHELQRVLLRRFAQPSEVASAAAFLASDQSSFMTGAVVVIDGGITAWNRI